VWSNDYGVTARHDMPRTTCILRQSSSSLIADCLELAGNEGAVQVLLPMVADDSWQVVSILTSKHLLQPSCHLQLQALLTLTQRCNGRADGGSAPEVTASYQTSGLPHTEQSRVTTFGGTVLSHWCKCQSGAFANQNFFTISRCRGPTWVPVRCGV
jgi:hypothetical protein